MSMTEMINEVFQAAQTGDSSRLQALLAAHPELANAENGEGLTPLGYAAHFGQIEAVRVLLQHGAEVNALSHSKLPYIPSNTALHAAIAGERSIEVINLLLENGADTTIFDSNGHTSLHTAAFHADNREIIALLLAHGAEVNATAPGGKTALAIALERDNHQVAELLREHGAVVEQA